MFNLLPPPDAAGRRHSTPCPLKVKPILSHDVRQVATPDIPPPATRDKIAGGSAFFLRTKLGIKGSGGFFYFG